MADNLTTQSATLATIPTSSTVRSKDRSGTQSQIVLLDVSDGTDAEQLGMGKSLPIIFTSANLTTTATPYTIGDQCGNEITVANAVRANRGATIQSAVLVDKAKVTAAMDLFIFSAATTPAADNAANAWSDADMLNCLGVIHFTDVIQSANNYVSQATNLPIVIKPGSGTSIYCNFVTRFANAVFGAVGDMQVTLGILQD